MKLTEARERWKPSILQAAAQHGARNVRVFGSAARDESSARDLDLLVDMEPSRSMLDLVALVQELEAALGVPVDVVTADGVSPHLRAEIIDRAIPL